MPDAPCRTFTDEFYAPIKVRTGTGAAGAIVVRAFADQRPGGDPRAVFAYEPPSGQPRVGRAPARVGEGVAHAFVRGLAAPGFQVTDETKRADAAALAGAARAIITGRVAEFGITMSRSTVVTGSRQRVGCRVTVEVRDTTGARRLWERGDQRVLEGSMDLHEPFHMLARTLADVVEQAATDPDFAAAVAAGAAGR